MKNASCSRKVNRVYFRSLDRDSWTLVPVPAVAPFRSQVDRNGDAPLLFLYYQRSSPRCYCLLGQHDRYCVLYKLNDISPIFLTPRLRISCERRDIKLRATNAYFFSIRADIFSWKVLKKICLKERISNVVDSSESFVNIAKSNFVNILNVSDTSSQNVVSDWL